MKIDGRYIIGWIWVIGIGLFLVTQLLSRQDLDTQSVAGYAAAGVIAVGMAGYAWVMFAGRDISRGRLEQSSYPTDIEDAAPTGPIPAALAGIDELLKASGYVLDSERRGLHSADGTPTVSWHYRDADSTAHALIALSPNGKDAGMLLTTYFEDETQLTTRLSRTIPKIERLGYESHSVERLEDMVKVHSGHMRRLAAAHGSPLSLATFEAEHRLAEKTYQQNMGYMFDAMWRRNLVWLAAVEGIGLLALASGLVQLLSPAQSPVKGLAILVGGAALMSTLALSGLAALRRPARKRPD